MSDPSEPEFERSAPSAADHHAWEVAARLRGQGLSEEQVDEQMRARGLIPAADANDDVHPKAR